MSESIDLEHSSAHSLNCDSDFKDVHSVPQQSIAKISRGDLEDLYYQLHDENIEIKKKFNSLDSKYKIMSTRVMRLSRDHKCVDSIEREEDHRQLEQLRQNEAALRAKVTVLRGQLASHTRLHSAALSKTQRPRSHRCSRSCHTGGCGGDDDSLLEVSRSGSQIRNQSRHRSTSRSGSRQGVVSAQVSRNQSELEKANAALHEEVTHLKERINILQKDLIHSSERSQTRIQDLETELGKHLAQETVENVELIKARRMIKQQEATIMSLQQEHHLLQRELQASKAALNLAAQDQDELCSTLMKERQRSTDLQQDIVKLSQKCSSIREMEEQLNDAKKENAVLKEHSNRLLQLTTGVVDAHSNSRSDLSVYQLKHNQLIIPHTNNQEITSISEENSAIQLKLENLKQQQSSLHEQLKDAQNEILALHKKICKSKEEHKILSEEHVKVQQECSKLRIELAEPNEEKKRLSQQLAEVRNECAHISEELSKCKSELMLLHQEQQDLHHTMQARGMSALVSDRNGNDSVSHPTRMSSHGMPVSNHSHFYTPQLAARSNQFLSTPQSHSHPSTPRPRVGDACLALLEQTAIRPSPGPFPGPLASHGSLQERFLELCIPTGSTAIPPVPTSASTDDGGSSSNVKILTALEDTSQKPCSPAVPSPRSRGLRPPQPSGLSDTQWELDKCRELLRVQFNLNSFYKKEVASLNNIVQSLTSSTQDASKKENLTPS